MELRNRSNGGIYEVSTETDGGGFMIYAKARNITLDSFCMHYRSLEEFNNDWEDVD